jgi:hypothetical protein
MAGHFVIWRISTSDADKIMNIFPASAWTGVAHAAGTENGAGGQFPGWTDASRAELNAVRGGTSTLENRNNLPPHKYLSIPAQAISAAAGQQLWQCDAIRELSRPSNANFNLTDLCATAQPYWQSGNKIEALIEQVRNGAASIEVYYIGRKEVN